MNKHKNNIVVLIGLGGVLLILCYTVLFPYKYQQYILKASQQYHIAPNKIAAIIRGESNFNPDNISKKGAVGLMQLMPRTARYIGQLYHLPYGNLKDPEQNIMLGTAYLAYLDERFTEKNADIIAYNAGEGNYVKSRWKSFGETRRYLIKIKLFYQVYNLLYFWHTPRN